MDTTASLPRLALQTSRLTLVPCSPALARLALNDPLALGGELDAAVPSSWPHPGLLGLLSSLIDSPAGADAERGWGPWLLLLAPDRLLVGEAGFKGCPDNEGAVEIGYSIVPRHQRRGLATEAVEQLLQWALLHPGVEAVRAECDPANEPSIAVLRRLGLTPLDPVEGMLRWELKRPF
jgi:[ribosomal protein S5]-alanine N-acetyltransferase